MAKQHQQGVSRTITEASRTLGEARDEFGGQAAFKKALNVITDCFEAKKLIKVDRNEFDSSPDYVTRLAAAKVWLDLALPITTQSISTTELETESDDKGKVNRAVKLPPLTPDLEKRILLDRLDALNALPEPKKQEKPSA